ncbi:hypothetical protein, conserved [Eimeria brunetti]|uniref:Uncharacterized protein n=1 Tax=Eimeria brunetti TaxID=51314 RepID=U6LTP0_9EIME|nr:hypothetical protein, conserved [Eimeria brunetti]
MASSPEEEVEEALKGLEGVAVQLQSLLQFVCRKATAIASTSGFEPFPAEAAEKGTGAAAAAATAAAAAAEAAAAEAKIIRLSLDAAESIERVWGDKPSNPRLTDVIKQQHRRQLNAMSVLSPYLLLLQGDKQQHNGSNPALTKMQQQQQQQLQQQQQQQQQQQPQQQQQQQQQTPVLQNQILFFLSVP